MYCISHLLSVLNPQKKRIPSHIHIGLGTRRLHNSAHVSFTISSDFLHKLILNAFRKISSSGALESITLWINFYWDEFQDSRFAKQSVTFKVRKDQQQHVPSICYKNKAQVHQHRSQSIIAYTTHASAYNSICEASRTPKILSTRKVSRRLCLCFRIKATKTCCLFLSSHSCCCYALQGLTDFRCECKSKNKNEVSAFMLCIWA